MNTFVGISNDNKDKRFIIMANGRGMGNLITFKDCHQILTPIGGGVGTGFRLNNVWGWIRGGIFIRGGGLC